MDDDDFLFRTAVSDALSLPLAKEQGFNRHLLSTLITPMAMDDDDFLFRTAVSDAAQGVVLARLAKEQGFNSASALYVNNAYGEGLANVFKEHFEKEGGKVVALVPQESGQPSYVSELRRATKGSPEVLEIWPETLILPKPSFS